MKATKTTTRIAALLVAILTPCFAEETSKVKPEVFADGNGAQQKRVDGMHQTRYIEIFLAAKDPETDKFIAACYNTMFLPAGIPASKDTAPQAEVAAIDFKSVAKEYGVLGASLNGPKVWLPDWTEIETGKIRQFGKITAPWVAQLNMGDKLEGVESSEPYKPVTIKRNSKLGWNKGTTALLLDAPDGTTWIMKGFQLGMEPKHSYNEFVANAAAMYKKLPDGWKVRVKKLEQDLIETPEGGVAYIMPDEHFNVFDKTGPGMTNYKP
jgi:hypothetical protein